MEHILGKRSSALPADLWWDFFGSLASRQKNVKDEFSQ
jgi:hypothetical protein